jgi:hypothetical protein
MELFEVYRTYERTEPTIGVLMSSPVRTGSGTMVNERFRLRSPFVACLRGGVGPKNWQTIPVRTYGNSYLSNGQFVLYVLVIYRF